MGGAESGPDGEWVPDPAHVQPGPSSRSITPMSPTTVNFPTKEVSPMSPSFHPAVRGYNQPSNLPKSTGSSGGSSHPLARDNLPPIAENRFSQTSPNDNGEPEKAEKCEKQGEGDTQ